jgi:hypothetical protein
MVLQACLGLEISALEQRVYLHYPTLPEKLSRVRVFNLSVGDAWLDLSFERHSEGVRVDPLRQTGGVEIVEYR